MNILLTGSSGHVGNELKNYFLKKTNYNLFLPVRKIKSKNTNRIKFFLCDLEQSIRLKNKIDIVIHCASLDRHIRTNKSKVYKKNILMTKNIIKFSNKKRISKIFFMSTMMVYKNLNKNKHLISEDDKFRLDFYAKSKIDSEKLLCSNKNYFKAICLRLPGVLTTSSQKGPLLKQITFRLIKNENIKLFNLKKKFNNLIDVQEIFTFISFVLKKKIISKVCHLAARNPMKLGDIIEFIKFSIKSKSKIISSGNNKKFFLISTKIVQDEFGFKPSTTINILKRYCKNLIKLNVYN
tara:strand:+ start:530 stop:1411 length:882 start_codon:yes stop_codon:yes gene_type:complete